MRDLANHIHFARCISPAAGATDNTPVVGIVVDGAGFDSLVYVINIGALPDADATFAALLEHGDQANLSDAVAVPDVQLTGSEALASFTFADDNKLRKLGYVGTKRYTRLTITPANNASASFISAIAVLGNSRHAPTPNPPG